MAFHSFHFLLSFIVVLLLARVCFESYPSAKKTLLLIASYYFYMCWDWRFAGLLLLITLINYVVGPKIEQAKSQFCQRVWLWVSLCSSLGILGYFKYANFFIEGMNELLTSVGFSGEVAYLNIVLPVGISFYTFQSISYTIDIYKGNTKSVKSIRDFALFVSFFPQLVAGPIVRAKDFLPQLSSDVRGVVPSFEHGIALILRGYIKKVAIADVLAVHFVDPAFSDPSNYSPVFLLLGIYAYSFQVYMDFSGYSDIARGIAKTLGYELQINFNRPYKAISVSNFWQRWHISMSSFFRDYLYFGLGGAKRGNVYANLMVTFIMIGIWHGAGWNFVLYGCVHGTYICVERYARSRRALLNQPEKDYVGVRYIVQIFWIFNLIAFSRLLFRGGSVEGAINYAHAMLNVEHWATPVSAIGVLALTIAVLAHYVPDNWTFEWKRVYARLPVLSQAITLAVTTILMLVLSNSDAPFVYFQF